MSELTGDAHEHFGAAFQGVDAACFEFANTTFDGCTFTACNLSEATFRHCRLIECSFVGCNLSLSAFDHSRLTDTSFEQCKLVGIDWTRAEWPRFDLPAPIRFVQCILTDASFFGLSLDELVLTGCKAQDADFREGSFCDADFSGTDFQNALFGRTRLTGADFTGAANYRIDVYDNDIKRAKFSRDEVIGLLVGLGIELVD